MRQLLLDALVTRDLPIALDLADFTLELSGSL